MSERAAHRIELETFDPERFAGQWVDIKAELSFYEAAEWDAGLDAITPTVLSNGAAGNVSLGRISPADQDAHKLGLALVAWSLVDRDGGPLPPTQQGVKSPDFPGGVGHWILAQAAEHYNAGARSAEDRKNLGGRLAPHSDQATAPISQDGSGISG